MSEMSDADVFGAPSQPPPLPAAPVAGDGSVVDAPSGAALNAAQTAYYRGLLASGNFDPKTLPPHQVTQGVEPSSGSFVDLNGNLRQAGQPANKEMSDSDVFAAPPNAPNLKPDNALGLYTGVMKPLDRLAGALDAGARDIGLPVDAIDAFGAKLGLEPSAKAANQQHLDFIARQATNEGVRPGKLGQFAGNLGAALLVPGGPIVSGAATGALLSDAPDVGGTAKDAAFGALGGKIGSSVIGGLAKVVKPVVAPAIQTLIKDNIPLTMGQITGGALRRVEDGAKSIPILGDMVSSAQARSVAGLNRAVANRALAPIGESVPEGVEAGRSAIAHAGDRLSARYNSLLPQLTIHPDQQFGQDLSQLGSQAATNLSTDHAQQLGRVIKSSIIDKIDPTTGQIPPEAMQDAETTLALKISRFGRSPYPADQDLSDAFSATREMIRDLVARNNPQAADELGALRQGWANLVIGENAAASLGAHEGLFTPGQLAGAVKRSDDTVRNRGYARGSALMQDLSDAALSTLPSKVPDSGSPFRHALEAGVAGLVGKEAGMGPALGRAGILGSILSAPYTKAGQPIMQNVLAGARPAVATPMADIIRRLRPYTASVGAVGLPQLTAQGASGYPQ